MAKIEKEICRQHMQQRICKKCLREIQYLNKEEKDIRGFSSLEFVYLLEVSRKMRKTCRSLKESSSI